MPSEKTVEEVREVFIQAADIVQYIYPPTTIDPNTGSMDLGGSIATASKSYLIGKVMDELIRRDIFEAGENPGPKIPRTL